MNALDPSYIYSIGEVSEMLNIKEHTLRFWEKEFPILNPKRTSNGRRGYSLEDIELLQTIKRLLYDQGFTTKGALKEIVANGSLDMVIKKEEENLFDELSKNDYTIKKQQSVSRINKESPTRLLKKTPDYYSSLEKEIQKELTQKLKNKVEGLIALWENYKHQ